MCSTQEAKHFNRMLLIMTRTLNNNNMSIIYIKQPNKREYFKICFCYDTTNSPNSSMQHDSDICDVPIK